MLKRDDIWSKWGHQAKTTSSVKSRNFPGPDLPLQKSELEGFSRLSPLLVVHTAGIFMVLIYQSKNQNLRGSVDFHSPLLVLPYLCGDSRGWRGCRCRQTCRTPLCSWWRSSMHTAWPHLTQTTITQLHVQSLEADNYLTQKATVTFFFKKNVRCHFKNVAWKIIICILYGSEGTMVIIVCLLFFNNNNNNEEL